MITHEREMTSKVKIPASRRSDIDWLRVIIVFLLLPYHSARVFDTVEPFYVKNSQVSEPFSWFIIIATPWSMPLLFFLAGASSWYALNFRSGSRYVKERFERLLVPLLFGMLVIVPPQAYYARVIRLTYTNNFLQFYPDYLQSINQNKSDYDGSVLTLAHLWFIFFLFIFSLLALPLFLYLKTARGAIFLVRCSNLLAKFGPLLVVPGLLVAASFAPDLIGHPALVFFVLFVLGFIFQADESLTRAINYPSIWALPLGLGAGIACLGLFNYRLEQTLSPGKLGFLVAYTFTAWYMLMGVVSLGHRFLNFNNALLKYLGQAAYPVYILHQTVIVMVAYYVVQWNMAVVPKFLIILGLSLGTSMALFELFIRRLRWLGFIFGLKTPAKS